MTVLGTVPMRNPVAAADELRRVLDLGLRGVEVTASIAGTFLGDDAFKPFWAAAEHLGALVSFEVAEDDPVGLVRAAGLGEEVERAILGGNAVRVLGLDG